MTEEMRLIILIALAVLFLIVLVVMMFIMAGQARNLNRLRREMEDHEKERDKDAERMDAANQANFAALANMLEGSGLRSERQMENLRESVDRRMEALSSSVDHHLESMQSDNAEKLEKMRLTVEEKLQQSLDERLARSFASVRQSLDDVYKGLGEMQGLAKDASDLKKVLSNVKTRGIMGEIQLGAILSQILAPSQYLENTPVVPGASERVEYAVRMPGDGCADILLPIDAKFPGDAYAYVMNAYDSGDKTRIDEARKALYSALRKAAKDIHDKYIVPPYTTDFAVMFLPFEGLYAEAINLGMMELAQKEFHVMIAGPSTVSALLNSLQMGFRNLAIQQNADRVWTVLGGVKTEFDKFEGVLKQAQQRINQANAELDKLIGTRTRMIQKTLRDVQTLGGPEHGDLDYLEEDDQ